MALHRLFIRPFNAEPGATGGSDAAVDRGDNIPEDQDLDPDNPDAVKTAAADETAAAALAAELEAKDEKDEKVDDPKKNARIPLSRHEAVLAKEREKRTAVEQQLAQYQNGKQVAAVNNTITSLETSITTMEADYNKLLTDGDVDKATALMAKIRIAERQAGEARSDLKIEAAEARAAERTRYDTALGRIEASYSRLNEDHADFDPEVMAEVSQLKDAYQSMNMTPTQALQKAVALLLGADTAKQEAATTVTPKVAAKTVAEERKAAAAVKTADAVDKTPPILAKVGQDGSKLGGGALDAKAVMDMSQKDFAKLNEADLARMRGDTL